MNKIKKVIMLIFCAIFISGCEVNYELTFNDSSLEENINIILSEKESTKENGEFMQSSLDFRAYAISNQWTQEKYNTELIDKNGQYIGNLNYEYTVDNFNNAHLINLCYDSFSFVKTDKGYSLVTSDTFECLDFDYMPVDKYNITITTNHLVSDHNADIVDGNKYTWIINSNGDVEIEKPIKITFSDATQKDQIQDNLRENSNTILMFILGGLILIIGVIYIIYYTKNKKNGS